MSMLGTSFSSYLIILDYQVNKKYIATHLCVNRDHPEMKCEGKCYLCKRIRKENKKDQDSSGHGWNYKFQDLVYQETPDFACILCVSTTGWHSFYDESLPSSFIASFFHPPQYLPAYPNAA